MSQDRKIIDVCCGGSMFWFDKKNPNVLFCDNRREPKGFVKERPNFNIQPDQIEDFRDLSLPSKLFKLVIFDPPHLRGAGKTGWQAKKYGVLNKDTWKDDLKKGFSECWRILKKDGVLIFKWNEHSIKLNEIRDIFQADPLFGHTTNNKSNTHWLCFMKF